MGKVRGFLPGFASGGGQAGAYRFRRRPDDLGCRDIAAVGDRETTARDCRTLGRLHQDRRDPDRVLHGLAEMIRYRAMLIAARADPAEAATAMRSDPIPCSKWRWTTLPRWR